ncbi:MAG: FecR domain-containing protein [Myxococcota bacterium]
MDDLAKNMERARRFVRSNWNVEREQTVQGKLIRRVQRRKAVRTVTIAASVLALCTVSAALGLRFFTPADHRMLHLPDGSTVTLVDADSEILTSPSTDPNLLVVQLVRGGARFSVTRNPSRLFRVEVGKVRVEVLGTQFSVRKWEERAEVTVTSGRVRVQWAQHSTELGAGAHEVFPPTVVQAPETHEPAPPAPKPAPPNAPRSSVAPAWRTLAQEGDFDRAYELLHQKGAAPIRDEPADLLLAADVARLSHHPEQAVKPLRQLLQRHRRDPRAPLAAFTLGRLLLEELGQPKEAALAFLEAQALDPTGDLAQDAIAREVQAWSKAGELARAREGAQKYLRKFPNGPRLEAVLRHAELE